MGAQATIQRWFADPLFDNGGACSTNPDASARSPTSRSAADKKATCDVTAGFCSNDFKQAPARPRSAVSALRRRPASASPSTTAPCAPSSPTTTSAPRPTSRPGLYAGLVIEPKGRSGMTTRTRPSPFGGFDAGTDRATRPAPAACASRRRPDLLAGGDRDPGRRASFREFLLELQDTTLTYAAVRPARGSTSSYGGSCCDKAQSASRRPRPLATGSRGAMRLRGSDGGADYAYGLPLAEQT